MYAQSKFRWVPEDPMSIALTWTRGRVLHESPGHLRVLDLQRQNLQAFSHQIEDAMVPLLIDARNRSSRDSWFAGLDLIGLTPQDVEILRFHAPWRPKSHPEVRRALLGIPLPNPFSQVWELRQMRSMYAGAEDLLEDAVCDLVLELVPRHGWDNLAAQLAAPCSGANLQWLVGEQRTARGEPGDPRREPAQQY
jgi:hypothetical protein